ERLDILAELTVIHADYGNTDEARRCLRTFDEFARDIPETSWIMVTPAFIRGLIAQSDGDLAEALSLYERSRALACQATDERFDALSFGYGAVVLAEQGALLEARLRLDDVIPRLARCDHQLASRFLAVLGVVEASLGDLSSAREHIIMSEPELAGSD